MKKVLQYTFFAGIGALFIFLAFRGADFPKLINDVKNANLMWIGLAWVAGMISNYSRAMRWTMIIEPLGYKANKANSFHGVMISYLINFAIPRGGELARAGVLSRSEKIPLPTVIGSVVAERVMDVLFMGLVFLLALGLQYDIITTFFFEKKEGETTGNAWLLPSLLALGIVSFLAFLYIRKRFQHLAFIQKINGLIQAFSDGIKAILRLKQPLLFVIHSLIIWLMYFFMVYCCFFAIPQTENLGMAAGLTVLVMSTVAVVLPAPGGMGTFHFFVSNALVLYGIELNDGLAYATIAHASQMMMFIVFGSMSLIWMLLKQRKSNHQIKTEGS